MKVTENVLVISDLHLGSVTALCPEFRLDDGGRYRPNKIQQWINRCWRDFNTKWLPKELEGQPYTLVTNGDLIEGVHHRKTQLISTNTKDHVKMVDAVIRPLAEKAKAFFVVRGTDSHVGDEGKDEDFLAWHLGARLNEETGSNSFYELNLEVGGVHIHFTHHIGTGQPHTDVSAPQGQLTAQSIEYGRVGWKQPDLQVRSHRHRYTFTELEGGRALVTLPAWQVKTGWVYKKAPMSVSQLGGVLIRIFDDGTFTVRKRTYAPKQPKIYKVGR